MRTGRVEGGVRGRRTSPSDLSRLGEGGGQWGEEGHCPVGHTQSCSEALRALAFMLSWGQELKAGLRGAVSSRCEGRTPTCLPGGSGTKPGGGGRLLPDLSPAPTAAWSTCRLVRLTSLFLCLDVGRVALLMRGSHHPPFGSPTLSQHPRHPELERGSTAHGHL